MSSVNNLNNIPFELLIEIFSWLPLEDRKTIRLTCSSFYDACCTVRITKNEILIIPQCYSVAEIVNKLNSCRYKKLNLGFKKWHFDSTTIEIWKKCGPKVNSLFTKHCYFTYHAAKNLISHCSELREWKLELSDDKHHLGSVFNTIRALNDCIENKMTGKNLSTFNIEVCSGIRCGWNLLIDKILIMFPNIKSFAVRKAGWADPFCFKSLTYQISRHLTYTQFENYIDVTLIEEIVFDPATNGSWFSNLAVLPSLRLKKIQATFLHPMEIIRSFFTFFSNQKQIEIVHLIFKNINEEILKQMVLHMLRECPNLQKFRLSYPNNYCIKFDSTEFRFILNLSKLKIFDVYFQLSANNLISDIESRRIDQNALRTLVITNAECTENERVAILKFFPYLHELELYYLTDRVLQAVFQYQTTLQLLKLNGIEECSSYGFTGRKPIENELIKKGVYRYSIKRLQRLTELSICTGSWTVSGSIFYEFEFPCLKSINISYTFISNPISCGPLLFMIGSAPSLTCVSLTISDMFLRFLIDEIFVMTHTILKDLLNLQLTVYDRTEYDQSVTHSGSKIYVMTKFEGVWNLWNSTDLQTVISNYTLPIIWKIAIDMYEKSRFHSLKKTKTDN